MKNTTYKPKNIDFTTRKSRLAKMLVEYFRDHLGEKHPHFGSILDKYAKIGMSKKAVAVVLKELVGDGVVIRHNTLDEAIKAEMAQGRTTFHFHCQQTGNQYHGNRGIKRRPPTFSEDGPIRIVGFKCQICKHKHSEKIHVTSNGYIKLSKRICPHCKREGLLMASFRFDSKQMHKAVISGEETFITPRERRTISQKEVTQ